MQIDLQPNEVNALIKALSSYLSDTRQEIGSTEDYDMRQEMHADKQALTGLLTRLGGSIADTNLSDIGADNPPWGGTK